MNYTSELHDASMTDDAVEGLAKIQVWISSSADKDILHWSNGTEGQAVLRNATIGQFYQVSLGKLLSEPEHFEPVFVFGRLTHECKLV